MRRLAAAAAVLISMLGAFTAANAPQASADSRDGCPYPYVCFYLTKAKWDSRQPTAMFKDKGYWQTLGSNSRGSYAVVNTRNDDAAMLKQADGYIGCAGPGGSHLGYGNSPYVEIKIVDTPHC
ncbi:hypothetical protein ACQP06_13600 [Nocardia sp. CA-136227]|uniref:hypothetical protein n=1 Tax=Nocardia sp. CA-136227 TaxID=3239979 RepID=UPI003D96F4C4